jgi:hypothetical protein
MGIVLRPILRIFLGFMFGAVAMIYACEFFPSKSRKQTFPDERFAKQVSSSTISTRLRRVESSLEVVLMEGLR